MNADQIALMVVSQETRDRIAALAQERGYDAPDEYLRALIEADAKQHGQTVTFDDDVDIRAELKEGLRQAIHGETVPLESLWEDDGE